MITPIFWIIPVASILALVFAWFFFRQMMKESEGTELMAKIARHVRKGAMSYLKQQYKVVASVFLTLVVLFSIMAYGFGVQNEWVPIALRPCRILRDEDGYLCFRPYRQCRPVVFE